MEAPDKERVSRATGKQSAILGGTLAGDQSGATNQAISGASRGSVRQREGCSRDEQQHFLPSPKHTFSRKWRPCGAKIAKMPHVDFLQNAPESPLYSIVSAKSRCFSIPALEIGKPRLNCHLLTD